MWQSNMEDEGYEGANPDDYGSTVMSIAMNGDPSSLRWVLQTQRDAREWSYRNDSKLPVIPLIALTFHPDSRQTQAVTMARLLIQYGARVDTVDISGTTPLWMAAQEGKQGAAIDATPRISTSQPIWIAEQSGHSHCVVWYSYNTGTVVQTYSMENFVKSWRSSSLERER
jgi:ankyrin repeat protein